MKKALWQVWSDPESGRFSNLDLGLDLELVLEQSLVVLDVILVMKLALELTVSQEFVSGFSATLMQLSEFEMELDVQFQSTPFSLNFGFSTNSMHGSPKQEFLRCDLFWQWNRILNRNLNRFNRIWIGFNGYYSGRSGLVITDLDQIQAFSNRIRKRTCYLNASSHNNESRETFIWGQTIFRRLFQFWSGAGSDNQLIVV